MAIARNLFLSCAFSRQNDNYKNATMRAFDHMKNNKTGKVEGASLPTPFGEIPKKLKEYYDSLQEEAIPARFIDLLERLDHAERSALNASAIKEPE